MKTFDKEILDLNGDEHYLMSLVEIPATSVMRFTVIEDSFYVT